MRSLSRSPRNPVLDISGINWDHPQAQGLAVAVPGVMPNTLAVYGQIFNGAATPVNAWPYALRGRISQDGYPVANLVSASNYRMWFIPSTRLKGMTRFTVTARVFFSGAFPNPPRYIFNYNKLSDGNDGLYMNVGGTSGGFQGRIALGRSNSSSPQTYATPSNTLVINTWTDLAGTCTGYGASSNMMIYMNGETTTFGTGGSSAGSVNDLNSIAIGGHNYAGTRDWSGSVIDFRLYSRLLTQDEIRQIHSRETGWDLYRVPSRIVYFDLAAPPTTNARSQAILY
jgi:hypothetical protein